MANKYMRKALSKLSLQVLEKSQMDKQDKYFVNIFGKSFIVNQNVFSPLFNPETEIFTREIVKLLKRGDKYLDIGPGTGVSTVMAALKGAHVVAVDINPSAINNIKENVGLHKVANKVSIRQGYVYSPIKSEEKFDVIHWNPPFLYTEKSDLTSLEKSMFDYQYQSLREYITKGRNYLKANGNFLLGYSNSMGYFSAVQQFAKEANLNVKLLFKTEVYEELYSTSFDYQLYQLIL